MKKLQHLLCLLLCLALCAALFPAALAEEAGTIAPAEDPAGEGTIAPAQDPEALPPADEPETVYTGTCGENLTWSYNSDSHTLTVSGSGAMQDYATVPSLPWNAYRGEIETIVIEGGVTRVGKNAFYGCEALTSVVLPSGLSSIGTYAFQRCSALPEIVIPVGVTSIESAAFENCTALNKISFRGAAPSINDNAFHYVVATAYYPTDDNSWTSTVRQNYGGTITWRNDSMTGRAGVTAYWHLSEDGVMTVSGTGDMWYWTGHCLWEDEGYVDLIRTAVVEEGVTGIGPWVFKGCTNLTSVTIPSSVTKIEEFAFQDCSGLPVIAIPEGVTTIEDCVFRGCSGLTDIHVAPGNAAFSSQDGILYDKARTTLLVCPPGKTGEVRIPEGVTAIEGEAFMRCSLNKITVPASVTSIGGWGFGYWASPKEVWFEGPAPTLADGTFDHSTVRAYYPLNDETWTEEVRQNYRGEVTWVPYFPADKYPNPFTDVPDSKYYWMPVLWAYYHDPQVTGGMTPTTFGPNSTCTRAQVMTFLWKAAGAQEPESSANPFEDIKEGKYYYTPVLWAVENGITSGMDDTHFGPNNSCTRAQVVTFLWCFAGRPDPSSTENPFKDVGTWNYYYKAVLWAVENGITSGMDDTHFGPNNTCTRGQVVTFLYKYMVR